MPLRAIVNNKSVIGPLINDSEWKELKVEVKSGRLQLILPCCGSTAFLRTSRLGTKHFVHKSKICKNWRPKSVEHYRAQEIILKACIETGYEAAVEYRGVDWIADVYATNDQHKIAFEVQWSPQTLEEFNERQDRYRRDNVRCCWFVRCPSEELIEPCKYLPVFELRISEQRKFEIILHEQVFELDSFVISLLSGQIKYCPQTRVRSKQNVTIKIYETGCWGGCNEIYHFYYFSDAYYSICGLKNIEPLALSVTTVGQPYDFNFLPEIISAMKTYLDSEERKELNFGSIKKRKVEGQFVISFGCPKCDKVLGPGYWYRFLAGNDPISILNLQVEIRRQLSSDHAHWCYSKNKMFCV